MKRPSQFGHRTVAVPLSLSLLVFYFSNPGAKSFVIPSTPVISDFANSCRRVLSPAYPFFDVHDSLPSIFCGRIPSTEARCRQAPREVNPHRLFMSAASLTTRSNSGSFPERGGTGGSRRRTPLNTLTSSLKGPLTPNPPGADGSVKTSTSIHLPAEQQLELARCVKSWLTCKAVKAEEESTLGRPIAFSEWARALGVEESALRRQIADGKAARELLVKTNINLVKSMAVRLHQSQEKNENRLSVDDLILEGTQGILKAAAKFDPTRNVRFSTYAVWWIRQAISLAIQTHSNTVRLPVLLQTRIKKIKAARLRLYLQLEREPTHEEVGREELGFALSPFSRVERGKGAESVWGARGGSPQAVEGIDLSGACNALKCSGGWIEKITLKQSILQFTLKQERVFEASNKKGNKV
ncbi:rna sigma 70 subfamily [Nannochloropsis gaditana]|uniref:Rna sigma 70 subfamily n=1 Tax=Nannochloropsis gaditana TaxID=72520 RepID=W7T2L5_9STRA|nr:rna sigma 70 subfamily [Nannochloropsis gaditana]